TKKSRRKITSGARQAMSSPKRKKRSSVTVVFESAKPSATRKSSRLKIQATTRIERLRAQALCAESARGLHPGIDPLAKVLAGLEVGNPFLRHHDLLAGLGIATDPRRPVGKREAAEAADLDAMAVGQCPGHRIENGAHRELGVLRDQLRIALGEPGDQFRLRHGRGRVRGPLPSLRRSFHVHAPEPCPQSPQLSSPLLSSLARSSAPRLVVPVAAPLSACMRCRASAVSALSLALRDRLIERFLRST